MSVLHVTKNDFDSKVLNSSTPVLVDFWASWCGPCKMVAPIIEQVEQEFTDKLVVAKVDIDDEPEIAQQYGVQSIPTIMLFKNGEPVLTDVGARPFSHYQEMINNNL